MVPPSKIEEMTHCEDVKIYYDGIFVKMKPKYLSIKEAEGILYKNGILGASIISVDNARANGPAQIAIGYEKDGIRYPIPAPKKFIDPIIELMRKPEQRQCLSCGASQSIIKLNRKICSYCGNDY